MLMPQIRQHAAVLVSDCLADRGESGAVMHKQTEQAVMKRACDMAFLLQVTH